MEKFKELLKKFTESKDPVITSARVILLLAAIGGIVFVGAAAPGLFSIFNDNGFKRRFEKRKINNAYNTLKRRKMIELHKEKDGRHRVIITEKGKKSILKFSIEDIKINKPKKWDKKWRILIFDIPSSKKQYHVARQALREKIKELGFVKLQKSTWIHPYPCENELLYIAKIYQIEKCIEVLTVENFLNVEKYKKIFKL